MPAAAYSAARVSTAGPAAWQIGHVKRVNASSTTSRGVGEPADGACAAHGRVPPPSNAAATASVAPIQDRVIRLLRVSFHMNQRRGARGGGRRDGSPDVRRLRRT